MWKSVCATAEVVCATEAPSRVSRKRVCYRSLRSCVHEGVRMCGRAGVPLAYVYASCLLCLSSVIGGFWVGLHGAGRAAR
jgi:hypothetical protein